MKVLFFACALGVAVVFSAVALDSKPLSIDALAEEADRVVHGVVLSKSCQRDGQGRIFTRVQLRIDDVWKGSHGTANIVHAGGVLGDEATIARSQEQYAIGEEIVAFIKMNGGGEGVTVGMSQGKFTVIRRGEKTFVFNPFHGVGVDAPGRGSAGLLALQSLKERVQGSKP